MAVYLYLKDRANKEGTCYPAIGTIARELHLSVSTVKRAISDLEENGFFYGKLNNVEKELANSRKYFLRIHQSFLVNYDYITKMNFFNITISMNGKEMELKISEDRQKEVRRQLCTMAAGKAVIE